MTHSTSASRDAWPVTSAIFLLFFLACSAPIIGHYIDQRYGFDVIEFVLKTGSTLSQPKVYLLSVIAILFWLLSTYLILRKPFQTTVLKMIGHSACLLVAYLFCILWTHFGAQYFEKFGSGDERRQYIWYSSNRLQQHQIQGFPDHSLQNEIRRSRYGSFGDFARKVDDSFTKEETKILSLWQSELDPELAKIFYYVSTVSNLWFYGNASKPMAAGCANQNEQTNFQIVNRLSVNDYLESSIGCCSDYANFLKGMFDHAHFENRVIYIDGHVFNEVKVKDRWFTADATIAVFYHHAWEDLAKNKVPKISVPTFNTRDLATHNPDLFRPLRSSYRTFLLTSLAMDIEIPFTYGYTISDVFKETRTSSKTK